MADDQDSYVVTDDSEQEVIGKSWQVDPTQAAPLTAVATRRLERFEERRSNLGIEFSREIRAAETFVMSNDPNDVFRDARMKRQLHQPRRRLLMAASRSLSEMAC